MTADQMKELQELEESVILGRCWNWPQRIWDRLVYLQGKR